MKAGSVIIMPSCSMLSTLPSLGLCSTITVEPRTHKRQPTLPTRLSRSFRNLEDRRALTRTLRAPNGVTRDAGANA
uniref:Putative secreted protein n=1 Tax=Ixodes ricinus TaxID=34613 RepID=A0A6B0TTW5_IXORI